ncbi:MAG: hypothetical protein KF774_01500 [Planctomyces sp.]|nr:hypothetical protein [Planctomyces sp.]
MPEADRGRLNIPTWTLGGRQFWGDVAFFHGWRIQHNVFTGHYRLLDPRDVRQAWGSLAACRQVLDDQQQRLGLKPMSGRAVVLIHGVVRSSKSFAAMKTALERDGAIVVPFDYPSTRMTIDSSSEYLHQTLESLEGVDRIDFVVHSMGGLVVRSYLRNHRDPRLGRLVMLGVPNHGARLANILRDVSLFKAIFGPAGQQLIEGNGEFIDSLPAPDFPFAVVAGARGDTEGYNPLIPGDDDGTVSVDCTRLAGATDFMTVPAIHSFLMGNPDVIAATLRFLSSGALRESGEAQPVCPAPAPEPIPAAEPAPVPAPVPAP